MRILLAFGVLPGLLWMSGSGLVESRADEGEVRAHGEELLPRLEGTALTVVPLAGDEKAPLSGQACAWFSVAIGLRAADGAWATRYENVYSKSTVLFETPLGRMGLDYGQIRPHLEPSWQRRVSAASEVEDVSIDEVRGWILHAVERAGEAVEVVEYCLKADATIAARVQTETFILPPEGPEQEPVVGSNTVLQLWSGELREGEPAQALTPPYDDWSY